MFVESQDARETRIVMIERLTCEECCRQAAGTIWSFYENRTEQCFCEGCQYTFYVLVECGTEMHLPFYDAEGMRVRVFDAVTGDALPVRGLNECAAEVPRFHYCNTCEEVEDGLIPNRHAYNLCMDTVMDAMLCEPLRTCYENNPHSCCLMLEDINNSQRDQA